MKVGSWLQVDIRAAAGQQVYLLFYLLFLVMEGTQQPENLIQK